VTTVHTPTAIVYHARSRELELAFGAETFRLAAELLRVYSPSAEVRGHSPDERKLQTGKKHVAVNTIEPVGNYGVKISFDDGHDTGIYAWDYLRDLGRRQDDYWRDYFAELKAANASRLPTIPIVGHFSP
jgi:DUF971 family protein